MEDNAGIPKQKEQFLAARVSIFGSIVLFLISAVVGIAVDSITLLLDASASLVILVSGFLMHFSIKKVHSPPDDFYHFGYHKYEPLTAFVQNFLIIAMCVVSVKFAIQDIVHADEIHGYSLPAIATFFSGVLGFFIMIYLSAAARRTGSQMIKSASFHWLSDVVLSFGVSAGFFFGFFMHKAGFTRITPYIDPLMSIILALFLVRTPFKYGMHSLLELLDAAPHKDIRSRIKNAVDLYNPGSFGVQRLRVRKAGQKVFIDICFLAQENLTIRQAEELSGNFEKILRDHIPGCDLIVSFKPKK